MVIYIKLEVLLQSIAVVLSFISILFLLLKVNRTKLTTSYVWCQSIVLIWSMGQILESLTTNIQMKWIYVIIQSFPICFIGVSWLFFSLVYTNNKLIKSPIKIILLLSIPFMDYVLVLTNNYHHLIYKMFELKTRSYGPLFWVNLIINYTFLFVGTIILVNYSIKQIMQAKAQTLLVIISVVIPVVSNLLHVSGLVNMELDITPISFAVTLSLLAIAMIKYKFLNIMPIALNKIVNTVEEAIVVVDCFDTVIYFNDLFYNYFKQAKISKNCDINIFIEYLKTIIEGDGNSKTFFNAIEMDKSISYDSEICVKNTKTQYFNVKIRPIKDDKKEVLGRIITLNNINEYVNLLNNLNVKNKELVEVNEELRQFASVREELAISKERNRFAIDLHDTLGHTMTLLLKLNEVARMTFKEDEEKTEKILDQVYLVTKEGMKELRRAISGLTPGKLGTNNLNEALRNLIYDFEGSGIEIELLIDGKVNYSDHIYSDVIYRSCQEALTNSMRHGNSNKVNIFLRFLANKIKLYIIDNGSGCKNLNVGFGLTGMKERVEKVKGSISFGSDGESGFNIHIEIPVADEVENA